MGVHLSGVVAGAATFPALAAVVFRKVLPLPVALVLWHVAGTGIIISIAASAPLARHTTWILGKRKDGSVSPIGLALLWPYHFGLRAKLAIQRKLSSEKPFNRIGKNFYLGAWPSEAALAPLVGSSLSVLDVSCELPLQIEAPAYLALPVWDTHGPIPEQIDQGVAWALEQERSGRSVLIHCAHGHGRSATVLCAILIAKGEVNSIAGAEMMLKKERPRVRLNHRQRAMLTAWLENRRKTT